MSKNTFNLAYCEYELILYMQEKKVWKPSRSPLVAPKGYTPGAGNIDLGLCLYWVHNSKLIDTSQLNAVEKGVFETLIEGLKLIEDATQLTAENYAFFTNGGELIYTDGSILGTKKWGTYDQGWFFSFLNLVKTVSLDNWFNGSSFPGNPNHPIPLHSFSNHDEVKIAIIGDWGTGDDTANELMAHVTSLNPDYIIHLGDVYYAGTPSEHWNHLEDDMYFGLGEEVKNLIDVWPSDYKNNFRSFTLNSNHEMYTGANGYFLEALKPSEPQHSVFNAQYGKSCFHLQFADFNILGLDSAYMGSAEGGFMQGKLGEEQCNWIRSLDLDPKKTIVLSHHNGFEADATEVNPLWFELREALGEDPYAWYWGHVHNGIAYNAPIHMNGKNETLRTDTFARCLGHAALPYGNASNLDDKPIEWRARNAKTNKELYNGFAMITVSSNHDVVDHISEDYYDLSPKPQPVFNKQILPVAPTTTGSKNEISEKERHLEALEVPQQVLEELRGMGKVFDASLYEAINTYLAPIIEDRDAALVACSDPKELKVVKNDFVIEKLGVTEDHENIDNAISYVCHAFGKSNRHKERVGFYYLLTVLFHKEDVFLD